MPEVVYELSLKDQLSQGLNTAHGAANRLEEKMGTLQTRITNVAEAFGISIALYGGMQMVHEGIEAFEALHKSEAQLQNTMENMGTYTKETFDKMIAGSKEFARGVQFSQQEIVTLQSQLGLVGNISDDVMKRMVSVSADMATKFGMGLSESGELLSKAINNPEMARRLAMRLKIDPGVIRHVQDLAKHGHIAEAQMELLAVAEGKVGGAAKAAFDADPMAQFNKMMYNLKIEIGEMATKILRSALPALHWMAEKAKELVHWIRENKEAILPYITTLGTYVAIITAVTIATKIWTTATAILNGVLDANPVVLLIAAIAGLIVYFYDINHKTETWQESLKKLWEIATNGINLMVVGFEAAFEAIVYDAKRFWLEMEDVWNQGVHAITGATDPLRQQIKDLHDGHIKAQADFQKAMQNSRDIIKNDWGPTQILIQPADTVAPKDLKKGGKKFAGEGELKPETKGAKGNKVVTINIKIDSLVKELQVKTTNLKDSAGKIQEAITQALMGAVNNSQIIAEH